MVLIRLVRRRASSLLLLLGTSVAFACGSVAEPVKTAPIASITPPAPSARGPESSCPLETPEQWQHFLERYAGDARWVKTCEDKACDAGFSELVEQEIEGVLDRCKGYLAEHAPIARCTRNLRAFVPSFLAQHSGDTYGFTVDNHTYLTAQESADRPSGMMQPPPGLVAAMPLRVDMERAARKNGWKYLTHDSALEGVRTFVFIPDPEGRFDQWMLLNFLKKDQPAIDPRTPMSFIAVQKKDASGRDLAKVRLHVRDYNLVPSSAGFQLELVEDRNGKCYSCHPSGMRQLIPRRTQVLDARPVKGEAGYDPGGRKAPPEFAFGRLQELNARLRSYGMPDWEGRVVPEHHGPALGAALGCTSCHDGTIRGPLTVSTSPRQLQQKIYDELAMPPATGFVGLLERSQSKQAKLSPEEHRSLDAAFEAHGKLDREFNASRLPELERWLLEEPCRLASAPGGRRWRSSSATASSSGLLAHGGCGSQRSSRFTSGLASSWGSACSR